MCQGVEYSQFESKFVKSISGILGYTASSTILCWWLKGYTLILNQQIISFGILLSYSTPLK